MSNEIEETHITVVEVLLKFICFLFLLIIVVCVLDTEYFAIIRENNKLHEIQDKQESKIAILDEKISKLQDEVQELFEEQDKVQEELDIVDEYSYSKYESNEIDKLDLIEDIVGSLINELVIYNDNQAIIEQIIEEQQCIPDSYPISNFYIGSGYGYREDPASGSITFHSAIDFVAPYGTAIYAAGSGIVIESNYEGSYGNLVTINHGNGYKTMYAHCSSLLVSVGQWVEKGQQIATVGATGYATGYHLHYSLLYDNNFVNPYSLLDK